MKVNIVVAVCENQAGIGRGGKLPWPSQASDLRHFRRLTEGHAVVMGRVTAESIGKPLPNRHNIVLASSIDRLPKPFLDDESVCQRSSLLDALDHARLNHDVAWLIGGERVYREGLPLADEVHVTIVHGDWACDRRFPDACLFDWACAPVLNTYPREPGEAAQTRLVYRRLR